MTNPVEDVPVPVRRLTSDTDNGAVRANAAVAIVLAFQVFLPVVMRHGAARWPDLSHIGAVVDLFLLYVFAYGMIGVLGGLKGMARPGAAKAAH